MPDWGVYCPHGLKIMERVPGTGDCRYVELWPCSAKGCTRERSEEEFEREADEYWTW